MIDVRPTYLTATERLESRQDDVRRAYEHIQTGTLTSLDTPERIRMRLNRLLDNPLIARLLHSKGIEKEALSRPLDALDETTHGELERVIDGADFMPIWFLTRGAELRRTVARIRARCNGTEMAGTGFLVGPRLLLTNYHVLDWTDIGKQGLNEIAPESLADFDLEEQVDGGLQAAQTFRLQPSTLLLASPWHELDYVLVAVEPRSHEGEVSIEEYGYNRLAGDQGKISKGESVFIIQHPAGQPKAVVIQENHLMERQEDSPYLTYEADTDTGSSGAPVFNRQWEVIGLHHAAQIAREDGVILTRDGSPWTPDMSSANVQFLGLNEGIRISYILRDLSRKRDAIRAGAAAAVSGMERWTPEGVALLDAALQFQHGVSPAVLNAPIAPPRPRITRKGSSRFSRPD